MSRIRLACLSVGIMLFLVIAASPALQSSSAMAAESSGGAWGADYFPNVVLTSQDGQKLRFFDDIVKGKVVMINMIFTSCPDVCPLETARLAEVQRILGDRVGKDVFMYSITIDPDHDTPEVLKEYAEKYHAGPGWTFLTGNKDDITLLRRKLGMYDEEVDNEILSNHGLSMIMGNQPTGQWMKASPFENPYVLATKIGSWLHNWKMPSNNAAKQSYAKAPKLRNVGMGETLYRTRCTSCHTIGADKDSLEAKRAIGPDLGGVTFSRDRDWLIRWITEPDKMLAEKEPLAMSLLAAYNDVPMPNFHLSNNEILALIDYIEEETVIKAKQHDDGHHHHHGGEMAEHEDHDHADHHHGDHEQGEHQHQ